MNLERKLTLLDKISWTRVHTEAERICFLDKASTHQKKRVLIQRGVISFNLVNKYGITMLDVYIFKHSVAYLCTDNSHKREIIESVFRTAFAFLEQDRLI